MRMEKTASTAKDNGYDYFCTTLSVSPYKNALWINEIGRELEDKYKVKWLYSDFKKKMDIKNPSCYHKNIICIDKITVDVYILNHSNFFYFIFLIKKYAATTTAIASTRHIVPIIIYFVLAFPALFLLATFG